MISDMLLFLIGFGGVCVLGGIINILREKKKIGRDKLSGPSKNRR